MCCYVLSCVLSGVVLLYVALGVYVLGWIVCCDVLGCVGLCVIVLWCVGV